MIDIYTLNKKVEEAIKIIEHRYMLLYEEIKEKNKLKMKMIEDHYN